MIVCYKWRPSNDLYKLCVCVCLIFLSFYLVAFASAFSTVKSVFACSFFHRMDLLYPYQNEMWNECDAEREKEKDNIELAHHANMHYGWLQCEDEIPLSCPYHFGRLHAGIYHETVVFDLNEGNSRFHVYWRYNTISCKMSAKVILYKCV